MTAFARLLLRINCDDGLMPKTKIIKKKAGAFVVAQRANYLSQN